MIKKLIISTFLIFVLSTYAFALKHGSVLGNDLLFGSSSTDFLLNGSSVILLAQ